jgi:hypothetical protein
MYLIIWDNKLVIENSENNQITYYNEC